VREAAADFSNPPAPDTRLVPPCTNDPCFPPGSAHAMEMQPKSRSGVPPSIPVADTAVASKIAAFFRYAIGNGNCRFCKRLPRMLKERSIEGLGEHEPPGSGPKTTLRPLPRSDPVDASHALSLPPTDRPSSKTGETNPAYPRLTNRVSSCRTVQQQDRERRESARGRGAAGRRNGLCAGHGGSENASC
jgi:hypothetical protein